jgi:hypothetical protein
MLQNSWVQNWVQFIRWSSAAIDLTYLFFIAPPILSFGTALRRTVRAWTPEEFTKIISELP